MNKHHIRLSVILGILLCILSVLVIVILVLLYISDERALRDIRGGTTIEEPRDDDEPVQPEPAIEDDEQAEDPQTDTDTDTDPDDEPVVDSGDGMIRWVTADNWIGFTTDEEATVAIGTGGITISQSDVPFPLATIAYELTRPREIETHEEAFERSKQAILSSYLSHEAGRRILIDGIPAEPYYVTTRIGTEWVYFLQVSRYIVHVHVRSGDGMEAGEAVMRSIDFYPDEVYIESARRVGT